MIRRPPRSTLPASLFPHTPLFRSERTADQTALQPHASSAAPGRTNARSYITSRVVQSAVVRLITLSYARRRFYSCRGESLNVDRRALHRTRRSEEHTSELQSLMRNSYAVLCLKIKTPKHHI